MQNFLATLVLASALPLVVDAPAERCAPAISSLPAAEDVERAPAALGSSWSAWQTVSSFPGLQFRTRRGDYNEHAKKYLWWVEVESHYKEKAYVSIVLTPPGKTGVRTTDRLTIRPGGTDSTWFLVASASQVSFWADKLRVGANDSGPYVAPKD